jgi:MFS family permease
VTESEPNDVARATGPRHVATVAPASNAPQPLGTERTVPGVKSRIPIGPARTILTLVSTQLAAGIGFYAVTATLIAHVRNDLGLLAVAASLLIGTRTAVQYGLYLPAGALADRLGPARIAAIGCLVRATGFAVLAAADGFPALVGASILIGIGGCAYTPAGYSIVASLPDRWARRGFAWYTAIGQLSAVVGPVVGLLLAERPGGFANVAWLAAVSWAAATALVALLKTRSNDHAATAVFTALGSVRRDRALIRFAIACSPATLLVTEAAVAVPLAIPGPDLTTLFLSSAAVCAALAQLPLWRSTLVRNGLPLGFSLFATAYALLIPAALLGPGTAQTALVGLAGVLDGLAQGALLPALFHQTRRVAPPGFAGAYFGAVNFVAGAAALAGGAMTGLLFDHEGGGAMALICLAGCATLAANATARGRTSAAG